jgi:hypothetical protein
MSYNGGRKEAGMYTYDKSLSLAIDTANAYHALYEVTVGDIIPGVLNGWTQYDGRLVDANVTSEANNGGKLQIVCSGNHLLTSGDIVSITKANDATHNDKTVVTVDNATTFTCDNIAYTAGAGASSAIVREPAYLKASVGSGGVYHASFSCSYSTTGNKQIKCELNQNVTDLDNIAAERLTSSTVGNLAASGNISVVAGDKIWVTFMNLSGTEDIVIKHGNLNLHKL